MGSNRFAILFATVLLLGAVHPWGSVGLAQEECVETKLLASDGETNDEFGVSVGISGDVAVVGARYDADNGPFAGAAYIYRFDGSDWLEEAKLLPSDGEGFNEFGVTVAISGDVVVVAAVYDNDNGENSGSAYIFRFSEGKWIEEAKLLASDGAEDDHFGNSLAISEGVVVVGAYTVDDDNGTTNVGSAYVFRSRGDEWIQEAQLLASDGEPHDLFGESVAIDGGVILVGAHWDDDNGNASGSAYAYRFDGDDWIEEAKLLASDGASLDSFGHSVAVTGNVAFVGAYRDDEIGICSGSAYVYRFDGNAWIEEAKLVPSDGAADDRFATSVAVCGDTAIIGAAKDDDNGVDSGSAYIYRFDGTAWIEERKLLPSEGASGDLFGHSVGISGDAAIGGLWRADDLGSNSGSAVIFDCSTPECPADVNGDGAVDPLDSGFVLARLGCVVGSGDPDCDLADVNDDGVVDPLDMGFVLSRFGDCP